MWEATQLTARPATTSAADRSPISRWCAARPDGCACKESAQLRAVPAPTNVSLQLVDRDRLQMSSTFAAWLALTPQTLHIRLAN